MDEEEFSEALAVLREGQGTQAETDAMWSHLARRKSRVGFEQFCVSLAETVQLTVRFKARSMHICDFSCACAGGASRITAARGVEDRRTVCSANAFPV